MTTNTTELSNNNQRNRDKKDYKNAYYFDYFRTMEREGFESVFRSSIGLRPINYQFANRDIFSCLEFTINSRMFDNYIESEIIQTYNNGSSTPVEGKYSIPLPPQSIVNGFTIKWKDNTYIGKIKENIKASNQYDDSIASGNQAFLAEKSADGIFNFKLGNIPPGEKVTITISIISEIYEHCTSYHCFFHKYLFPNGNFNFNFNLDVSLVNGISDIDLIIQPLNVIKQVKNINKDGSGIVKVSTECGFNQDLLVIVQPNNDNSDLDNQFNKPTSTIEFNEKTNSYAVALNFLPSFESLPGDEIINSIEYIFLIDCSGSMSGIGILKAKCAMEFIVKSLNEHCKFNVYLFGSTYIKAFESSRMYTEESLDEISIFISKIEANLGGTMLYEPLVNILSTEPDPKYPRQLFILTDGEVSNRDKLVNYVSDQSSVNTRIFTLGIGNSVDRELVIGLSRACKGYYELIHTNSDIEEKVMKLLSISMEPMFVNISIDWGNLSIIQGPSNIRPVYSGERLMIYGLIENINNIQENKSVIVLHGDGPTGKRLSFPIELDFSTNKLVKSNSIHTITAFNIIKDLEFGERIKHLDNKNQIVQLGKKFNIVSKHTSFIVTIESLEPTFETMKTIDIKHTEGQMLRSQDASLDEIYQNIQSTLSIANDVMAELVNQTSDLSFESRSYFRKSSFFSLPSFSLPSFKSISDYIFGGKTTETTSSSPLYNSTFSPLFDSKTYDYSVTNTTTTTTPKPTASYATNTTTTTTPKPTTTPKEEDLLLGLIKLQKANGSWSTVSDLFEVDLTKKPNTLLNHNDEIWLTIIVIAKIVKSFPSLENKWSMAIKKSNKWLKSQLALINLLDQYNTLFEQANQLI